MSRYDSLHKTFHQRTCSAKRVRDEDGNPIRPTYPKLDYFQSGQRSDGAKITRMPPKGLNLKGQSILLAGVVERSPRKDGGKGKFEPNL